MGELQDLLHLLGHLTVDADTSQAIGPQARRPSQAPESLTCSGLGLGFRDIVQDRL